MIGTVYKSTGSWYKVKLENGKFIDCRLLGKFREKNIKSTNPVCVGDVVKLNNNKNTPATNPDKRPRPPDVTLIML